MSRSELLQRIFERLQATGRGRQVMLLGTTRGGKTTALHGLGELIQRQPRLWVVYGPSPASQAFTPEFYSAMATWLENEGLLTGAIDTHNIVSLTDFWQRVHAAIDPGLVRHIVILFDDANLPLLGPSKLADLFSTVRGFQAEWQEIDLHVNFVWAGQVLPSLLLEIYRGQDSASWPFVRNQSLLFLPELSMEEVHRWLHQREPAVELPVVRARYLYELSMGDVTTTVWIISKLTGPATCANLAQAAEEVIKDSEWQRVLISAIQALSPAARACVALLLQGQVINSPTVDDLEDELLLSGLVRLDETPDYRILRLRNWVVEATLRGQKKHILPFLGTEFFGEPDELIPPIQCLNQETFALIVEIETLLRNLIRNRLGEQQNNRHPFQGLIAEKDPNTLVTSDQFQRSSNWKKRVATSRWVSAHSALVSYTDTRELLSLFDEITGRKDSAVLRLREVRVDLEGFKAIRDAVMHGQIITEDSLDKLIEIRRRVYTWLAVAK